MGIAGICHACQNDVIEKINNYRISCRSCNATWSNMKGGGCEDCVIGKLQQNYPNNIFCVTCNTKWNNGSLAQFGKSQRGYYASKYKKGRSSY